VLTRDNYPYLLASLFVAVFAWLAVEPFSRTVWIAEVIPVVFVFLLLAVTFGR